MKEAGSLFYGDARHPWRVQAAVALRATSSRRHKPDGPVKEAGSLFYGNAPKPPQGAASP